MSVFNTIQIIGGRQLHKNMLYSLLSWKYDFRSGLEYSLQVLK